MDDEMRALIERVAERYAGRPGFGVDSRVLASDIERLLRRGSISDPHTIAETWRARGMDCYVVTVCLAHDRIGRKGRASVRRAYRALLRSGQIAPSLEVALVARTSEMVADQWRAGADSEIDRAVEAGRELGLVRTRPSVSGIGVTARGDMSEARARRVLAGLKVVFGRDLSEISVLDWRAVVEVHDALRDGEVFMDAADDRLEGPVPVPKSQLFVLRSAYAWASAAGLVAADPAAVTMGIRGVPRSLRRIERPRKSIAGDVTAWGHELPPTVLEVIVRTYGLLGGGYDRSTIRTMVYSIGVFFRAVRVVIPDHDSLLVPFERVAEIVQELRYNARCREGTRERRALGSLLTTVRSVYRLVAYAGNRVPNLFEGLESASPGVPMPVTDFDIKKAHRRETRARQTTMKVAVDALLGELAAMTQSALEMLDAGVHFVAIANDTPPGAVFLINGDEWRRGLRDLDRPFGDGPVPSVAKVSAGVRHLRRADVVGAELVRDATCWLVARHAGARREELAEITIDSVTEESFEGEVLPALRLALAKVDEERLVPLHPEAESALYALVNSLLGLYGKLPRVARYDSLEHAEGPVAQYLFLSVAGTELAGASLEAVRSMHQSVQAWHAARMAEGSSALCSPHMARRLFASDLVDAGVDIVDVMELLGHHQLETTKLYVFRTARRRRESMMRAIGREPRAAGP